MALENEVERLADVVADIPHKIQVQILDSVDSDRIARSLESIADSLSVIARDFR